ncbi:MAG: Mu transposase C-terminal domain-containing protein, partial [Rhodospirillales bacterium]
DNAVFIHPELGAYVGAKVQIRYDAADMGRVYVFDANEGHFICAAECPDRTGISREAAATHARNLQKQVISAGKKELRATVKRIKPETVAEELIAAGQNESNIVVALPRAGDAHETDALNAAAIAVIEHNGPKHFKELTIEEREAADALWARYNSDDEDAGTGTGDTESKVTKVDFGARAAAESERPIFTDDRAWALWVLNNPEEADDDERAEVTRRMKSTTFRQWVGMGEKESRLG